MSNWTPGPWLLVGHTVYALDETGGCNRFSCSIQGGYSYHGRTVKERTTHEEIAANAHLVAAAPDLYEALIVAQQAISGVWEDFGYSAATAKDIANEHPSAIIIDAALAKARGETQ